MAEAARPEPDRELLAALCDDAESLLTLPTPRIAGAQALLDRARRSLVPEDPLLVRVDALEALARRLDATTRAGTFAGAGLWGWLVTAVFVAIGGGVLWIAWYHQPSNLAEHAEVKPSSHVNKPGLDPNLLVDGDPDTVGVHTAEQRRPNVTLDLQEPQEIGRIEVHRPDGLDTALRAEISLDGKVWGTLASKGGKFTEWTIASSSRARYLRISATRRGELQLSEVKVLSL